MGQAVAYHPNSTTKSLKQPAWELLLKRVGEPLMTHLLVHCAIFVPLSNNCHLQVSGRPINDVGSRSRNSLDFHVQC